MRCSAAARPRWLVWNKEKRNPDGRPPFAFGVPGAATDPASPHSLSPDRDKKLRLSATFTFDYDPSLVRSASSPSSIQPPLLQSTASNSTLSGPDFRGKEAGLLDDVPGPLLES